MKKKLLVKGIVVGMLLPAELLLASCARHEPAAAAAAGTGPSLTLPAGLKTSASILDLMHDPVDKNANALWQAVSSVSTAEGTKDIAPTTDEEWLALRRQALVLGEAANLLVIDGRPVAHPGQKLESPPDPSSYTTDQAQAEITKDRAVFVAFAAVLQASTGQLVAAIDSRNLDQYQEASGALDAACESCHKRFWYPEAKDPPGL